MMANAYRAQTYRKRLPRYKFEASDRTLLQNLVNKYIGILERKALNQNMLDEKKRTWQIITRRFNSQSIDKRERDAKQLRKCWENMKWRARREVKLASMDNGHDGDQNGHDGLQDVTHPLHLTSSLVDVDNYMGEDIDDEIDDDEEDDDDEEYEEEEEIVAPMGTEPIEINEDDSSPPPAVETNGESAPLMSRPDPCAPGNHPISHPPDDELIGSFVADAWMAEDAPGENDDRENLHLLKEDVELIQPAQEHTLWSATRSSSPARSMGGSSMTRTTRTPPGDANHDHTPRAPSVTSSVDAAESLSSRHSISSLSRKRPASGKVMSRNHASQLRASPPSAGPVVFVDGDAARSGGGVVNEAERQLLAEEEHAKRMELLQAQLDYEKSKVDRMRRMMEMSEIEHRARMRMLVRYQQVAEKQKEYWNRHCDRAKAPSGPSTHLQPF